MLSGSCTLPPCSCSPLGCSMRLLCSCSLPPMPDSVYTSLENGDQSYVPLSTNQPSPKLGQAVLFKGRLALHARHLNLCGCSSCLPGSCTLLPCSCSVLGSCPLPPMLNSVYVSLERVDQSFVLLLHAAELLHAAAVLPLAAGLLLHAAAGLLLAAADAQLCLHVTYLKNVDQSFTSRNDSRHLHTP